MGMPEGEPAVQQPASRDALDASVEDGQPALEQAASAPAPALIKPGPHYANKGIIIIWSLKVFKPLLVALLPGLIGSAGIGHALLKGSASHFIAFVDTAVVILAIALCAIGAYWAWRRYWWELTDCDLHIHRGIVVKRDIYIPLSQIDTFDYTQKMLERIVGVVSLNIQVAGGARPEAILEGLGLDECEELYAELYRRMEASAAAKLATVAGGAPGDKKAGIGTRVKAATVGTAKEVKTSVVQSVKGFGGALRHIKGSGGGFAVLDNAFDSMRGVFGGSRYRDSEVPAFEHRLSDKELFRAAALSKPSGIAIVGFIAFIALYLLCNVGAPVLFAVIPVAWFIIVNVKMFGYAGFTVRRVGARIEVERGLITKRSASLNVGHLQSVLIRRTLLKRVTGHCEVRVMTGSNSMSSSSKRFTLKRPKGILLFPLIRNSDLEEFMANVLPEYSYEAVVFEKPPKQAFSRAISRLVVRPLILLAILGVVGIYMLGGFSNSGVLATALLAFVPAYIITGILLILCGFSWYKHAGYCFIEDKLLMRSGVTSICIECFPSYAAQWVRTTANFFQRRAHVCTVKVQTGASGKTIADHVCDLGDSIVPELFMWIHYTYEQEQPNGKSMLPDGGKNVLPGEDARDDRMEDSADDAAARCDSPGLDAAGSGTIAEAKGASDGA